MFPLDFPLGVLSGRATAGDWVLDPFCGRGTTNYAARMIGIPSIGIDSSRVATALAAAKLASTSPGAIVRAAQLLLDDPRQPEVPVGEFWEWAYDPEVLTTLCRLRHGLLRDCSSEARKALRAIVLGALHGPRTKTTQSYLSNQCPRTYAPKPRYSVSYWKERCLAPPKVDVLEIIRVRAQRYYTGQPPAQGIVVRADSRKPRTFAAVAERRPRWIVTSPPYYGMRTYIPDQWLRNWLLGGPSHVEYSNDGQLAHLSPDVFATQLRTVWQNVANASAADARLVIRFGGIADRKADPLTILRASLKHSGWRITTVKSAGTAAAGRRQALHFNRTSTAAREEFDVWTRPE